MLEQALKLFFKSQLQKEGFMKYLSAIFILIFLLVPFISYSETKDIISEGSYNMGDGETPSVAESRALLQAKRNAIEQAGTYVESYSKIKNLQLTEDEIKVMASGIMEISILDRKRGVIGDGFHFWVKIKARIDSDGIQNMAKKLQNKSVIDDYKRVREAYDASQKEIQDLKNQLAILKDKNESKLIEKKISANERMYRMNVFLEQGYNHLYKNDLDGAVKAFTSAIAIDDSISDIYFARATTFRFKKQFSEALQDYNRAIALNTKNARFYRGRAVFYFDMLMDGADKARTLNPNGKDAFMGRTIDEARNGRGSLALCIADYKKSCELEDGQACLEFEEMQALLNQ